MNRRFALVAALYLAHMLEEAFTGMHDDAPIVNAYALLAPLGERHAAYAVFQLTFAIMLGAVTLAARGERGKRAVLGALALALVAEGHHLVRAVLTASYNPGLLTALLLPFAGAGVLRALAASREGSSHRSIS